VAAVKFPHSGSTANSAIRTLTRALSYAQELGYFHSVPKLHLHKEVARERTFTAEEEARLLAVAPQPLADVFVMLMDTGLRPEEVFRLGWENVSWEQNTVRVFASGIIGNLEDQFMNASFQS
jgi:integrase